MTKVALSHDPGLAALPFDLNHGETVRRFTEAVRRTLDLLQWGPGCSGRTVLIKPNLVRTFEGKPGNTTDPRVLLALVRVLQGFGPKSILIGENPGCGVSSACGFRDSGCEQIADLTDAELVPFDTVPCRTVDIDGGQLLDRAAIPEPWLDADLVVNLPIMKTHLHAGVSLGIKNLHGILVDADRYFFHRMDVHQKMVDLLKIRTPDLTLVDGVLAMEGQSPFFGREREMDLLVAGTDPVAVDAVSCTAMGFRPEEIGIIRLAGTQGMGEMDLDRVEIVGAPLERVSACFERGIISSAGAYPGITAIELGACDGCLSSVRHSLDRLHYEGMIEELAPLTIVTGAPCTKLPALLRETDPERTWFMGDCTAPMVYDQSSRTARGGFVPGCAPHSFDLYKKVTGGG